MVGIARAVTVICVCAEIRRLRGADITVVLITGHDGVDTSRAHQIGATDFSAKPNQLNFD